LIAFVAPVLFAMAGAAPAWHLLRQLLWSVALIGSLTATVFLGMVLFAAVRYAMTCRTQRQRALGVPLTELPAVTILKPLYGMEPRLEENLESFFRQDYPNFAIIFGLRSREDRALSVVERLQAKHPQVQTRIVVSGEPLWPNAKVYSLNKMIASSAAEFLVISDSDVLVRPDFLRNVIPPLLNPKVGLVTCLYEGIPARGLWSKLEAMGMSIEMPSGVLVAEMVDGMKFALGAAMAVRRDAVEAVGGIREAAHFYSDDYVLGNRIAAAGYEIVLSHYKVGHVLTSRSLPRTLGDQLRWMKSTRFSRPLGHVGSGLTYAVPFGLLALLLGMGHSFDRHTGFELFLMAWLNRVLLALVVGWGIMRDRRSLWLCWLYPLRDLLGFGIWAASFSGKTFFWRGETYQFGDAGRITPEQRPVSLLSHDLPQGHD
jgi:ceramide glucosyltransferase